MVSKYAKPRWHEEVWKRVRPFTALPLRPMTRGALEDSLKMKAGDDPRWKTVLYPQMLSNASRVLSILTSSDGSSTSSENRGTCC